MPIIKKEKREYIMSYLKQSTSTNLTKKATASSYPLGYQESNTMVHMEPSPRPIATQHFDHNEHLKQKTICDNLKEEDVELFSSKNVIVKEVGNERQYKQQQQYASRSSVESLCGVMDEHNTVLKCNFIRPGFNASNTCFMCTSDMLRSAMKTEANEFNLKKLKINLSSDSSISPANGTMFLSLKQNLKTGKHMFYSLDYHIAESKDKKLFSQH